MENWNSNEIKSLTIYENFTILSLKGFQSGGWNSFCFKDLQSRAGITWDLEPFFDFFFFFLGCAVQTSKEKHGGVYLGEMEVGDGSCSTKQLLFCSAELWLTAIRHRLMVKSSLVCISHATSEEFRHVQDSGFNFPFVSQEWWEQIFRYTLPR